jgi:hypothetical protein
LLEIDQNSPKFELCDYYDPVFILEKLGIPGKDPIFDFNEQKIIYTIENEQQYLAFEQLYDILINNYKDKLSEKITNIDEKIENLKINIETSVLNFAQNRIDISAFIENSDINLVQSNEVYTKMFDELKDLSQKVKLIPETKGDSVISTSNEKAIISSSKSKSESENKVIGLSNNELGKEKSEFIKYVLILISIIIIFLFVIFLVYYYKYVSNGKEIINKNKK